MTAAPTTGKVGLGEARGGVLAHRSSYKIPGCRGDPLLDLQDPFCARVFKNALDGARKAGWKGKLRVAP